MIRAQIYKDEPTAVAELNKLGMTTDGLKIFKNSSGRVSVFFDANGLESVLRASNGSIGISKGAGLIGNLIDMMSADVAVTAEAIASATPIADLAISDTLANVFVVPGSIVLTDAGGTGPVIVDDGIGHLVEQNSGIPKGVVDYDSGVFSFTYSQAAAGSGNLTADYSYSLEPDVADVPKVCRLESISKLDPVAQDLQIQIWEEEAMATVPVYVGSIPDDGAGYGTLRLDHLSITRETVDLAKRDRRWVLTDAAVKGGAITLYLWWTRIPG